MDTGEPNDEIPIHTDTDHSLFEVGEGTIEEEDVGQEQEQEQEQEQDDEVSDDEDYGSHNELPDVDDIQSAYDIGDTLIILLKSKELPFLGRITEILPSENLLKITDKDEKEFRFLFEGGEILMTTDSYEIIDMIKVRLYDPVQESDGADGSDESEYKEVDFDSEILIDKIYSDFAKKDDLLAALIYSMNIYDNNSKIKNAQQTLDVILEMINYDSYSR